MPLSEHEQRLLSQMEQQIQADDPRFASTMRGATSNSGGSGKKITIAVLSIVVGLLIVITSIAFKIYPLGILAFVIMVAGVGYAFAPKKRHLSAVEDPEATGPRPRNNGRKEGLVARFEQRWHQRKQRGNF